MRIGIITVGLVKAVHGKVDAFDFLSKLKFTFLIFNKV